MSIETNDLPPPPETWDRRIAAWSESIGGDPTYTKAKFNGDLLVTVEGHDYPKALRELEARLLAHVAEIRVLLDCAARESD